MYGYELLMMAERLPGTCRVVTPIKLEFSASAGFIHKKSAILSVGACNEVSKFKVSLMYIFLSFSTDNRR